jgi:threonine/homoserine/homoserine lactone efflux protein
LATLVITRTLEGGLGAGLRVALAPLITDSVIIFVTFFFVTALPPWAVTFLAVTGSLYILYLAWEIFRSARTATLATGAGMAAGSAGGDLGRGVLVNLLSPNPWLFWIAVGSPTLAKAAMVVGPAGIVAYLAGFYLMLIGGKMGLAVAVAGGRRFLTDRWYRRLLVASALLLVYLALTMLWGAMAAAQGEFTL